MRENNDNIKKKESAEQCKVYIYWCATNKRLDHPPPHLADVRV